MSQAGVAVFNHAFHLYDHCICGSSFSDLNLTLGFPLGSPVSSLIKINLYQQVVGLAGLAERASEQLRP